MNRLNIILFKEQKTNTKEMPDLFPLLKCEKNQIKLYDPSRLSYGLGQICSTCQKSIVFQETITVCKCHRYCHKKCVIESLNLENKDMEDYQYRCTVCQGLIQVFYDVKLKPKCRFRMKNLIGFIFSFFLCVMLCYKTTSIINPNMAILVGSCITLSLSFTIFFIFLGNLIFVRENIINYVVSTNLQLVVSAFIGLDCENVEEDTQTDMIRN